jgi:sRNA-binding carbon storage regulator CsrA
LLYRDPQAVASVTRAAMMLKNGFLSNILLSVLVFQLKLKKVKLTVDAPLNVSIIRPTSGADETENSLIINELDEVSSEEGLRFRCLNRQR